MTTSARRMLIVTAVRTPRRRGIQTDTFARQDHSPDSIHHQKDRVGPNFGVAPPRAGVS